MNIGVDIDGVLTDMERMAIDYGTKMCVEKNIPIKLDLNKYWEIEKYNWSAEQEDQFKQPFRDQFEKQGHPYYASSRLWDDGVIDPAQSRHVLGLSLAAAMNAPIQPTKFGVFRM